MTYSLGSKYLVVYESLQCGSPCGGRSEELAVPVRVSGVIEQSVQSERMGRCQKLLRDLVPRVSWAVGGVDDSAEASVDVYGLGSGKPCVFDVRYCEFVQNLVPRLRHSQSLL